MSKLASFFLLQSQMEVPTYTYASAEWSNRIISYYLLASGMPWGFATHREGHLKYLLCNFILDGTLKEVTT